MGCDIHVYTEAWERAGSGVEQWWNCDHWRLNKWYDPEDPDEGSEYEVIELYGERNYNLFATLANVRNYGDTPYIAEPKGIPADVSRVVREAADSWASDGHSHSYFTLKQLRDFSRHHPSVKESGLISPTQYEKLQKGELPNSWCQGTSDKTCVHAEWVRPGTPLQPLIDALHKRMVDHFWQLRYATPEEIEDHEDKIRIVFWFDN